MKIEYPLAERPDFGQTINIADGLEWLRMPLPFSLNHINLWLLRDADMWVIVDTGVGTDESINVWQGVMRDAMRGDPASHVVATHMHPDHVGCAGYLAHYFDVDLWMTRDEYMLCRILVADTGRSAPQEGIDFYRSAGFSDEYLGDYEQAFGMFGHFVTPLPEAYKRLSDGDLAEFGGQQWSIITGGGHSPEHASLYDRERNILIAGDQLLPTISSNVSVWPTEPLANPLHDWLQSLRNLREHVREDVLVLPAHGKPFRGAYGRIDAIIAEHEQRLDSLREFCRSPCRAIDVFPTLYRTLINKGNRIMAIGEALAHLRFLVDGGEMSVTPDGGVDWYEMNTQS